MGNSGLTGLGFKREMDRQTDGEIGRWTDGEIDRGKEREREKTGFCN